MCNPAAIGAVIMVAGTAMQVHANNERKADMRRLNRRETERQGKYYGESKKFLDENQGLYDKSKVDADMAAAAAGRQAEYAAADRAAPRANEQLPSGQGGNSVIADAFNRALQGAQQQAGQQGAARSQLASFGDFLNNATIESGRNSGNIGMLGSFSQGSANVLPLELQHAATKERKSATYGNLLTALGSAMMGGAGGAGAAGGMGATGGAAAAGGTGAGAMASGGAMSPALFGGLY